MPDDVLVRAKHLIVIPRDAFELLNRRAAAMDDAEELAREMVESERQTVYVLKVVAIATIDGPPVKFRKV